jgi:hypothetical protein
MTWTAIWRRVIRRSGHGLAYSRKAALGDVKVLSRGDRVDQHDPGRVPLADREGVAVFAPGVSSRGRLIRLEPAISRPFSPSACERAASGGR